MIKLETLFGTHGTTILLFYSTVVSRDTIPLMLTALELLGKFFGWRKAKIWRLYTARPKKIQNVTEKKQSRTRMRSTTMSQHFLTALYSRPTGPFGPTVPW